MSAGAPSVSDPPGTRRIRAGFTDSSSTSRDRPMTPAMHEAVEAERHRRLEAGDAERRVIELDLLLVVVMRRVIGGDDVDAAVGEPLQHGVAVGRLAQRRVHLHVRVVGHRRRRASRR